MGLRLPVCWVVLAASALAAPTVAVADVEQTVEGTGALVMTWQGDPARGCAEQGVCDVRGTVVLEAEPDQGETGFGGTRRFEEATVGLSLDSGRVRVTRGPADDPLGVCTDLTGGGSFELGPPSEDPRAARPQEAPAPATDLGLVSSDGIPGLGAGRCAGPTADDVGEDLLPALRIPRSALARRRVRLDLAGERSFGAGPYAVQLRSTLVLTATRRIVRDDDDEDEGGIDRGPREVRRAAISLSFEATLPEGPLVTRYAGLPGRGCELFDACGVEGTATITPVRRTIEPLTVTLFGQAALARGRGTARVRRVLAALRAGRLRIDDAFYGDEGQPARLDVQATRAGVAGVCRDSREIRIAAPNVARDARGLRIVLGTSEDFGGARGPFRTRCPGPSPSGPLAAAPIPVATLAATQTTVPLRSGIADPFPYALTTTQVLRLRLRRTAVAVRVGRVPEGQA